MQGTRQSIARLQVKKHARLAWAACACLAQPQRKARKRKARGARRARTPSTFASLLHAPVLFMVYGFAFYFLARFFAYNLCNSGFAVKPKVSLSMADKNFIYIYSL
jgi:hypothetical protein